MPVGSHPGGPAAPGGQPRRGAGPRVRRRRKPEPRRRVRALPAPQARPTRRAYRARAGLPGWIAVISEPDVRLLRRATLAVAAQVATAVAATLVVVGALAFWLIIRAE